ncbi:MAG TPA: glycoside hydrolase domain-containing protein [Anaeromyxobacteraceae bacterium]|nr:glycoside hydrolase domain-containing protein [Anaeromyxobacteraceae bacterium]
MTHRPALLTAALLALAPTAASAASVWTAIATEKVLPAAKARSTNDARIAAARNEFEAFQVVVTGPATGVSASATELNGPGKIPSPKLYREELINITNASAADGMKGRIPDALVPDVDEWGEKRNAFPFDVPAGESRAVWVEVYVPKDAKPGEYTGSVTVKSSAGEQQVPVKLTVWDFELPSTASLKSVFVLGYSTLPAGHGVAGGSAAMADLRFRYGTLGLDHRISLARHDDGTAGVAHFVSKYGPLMDGKAPTRLPGAKLTAAQLGGARTTANATDWTKEFKSRGWFDRLFDYTCDEPPLTCAWNDITTRSKAVKAADPNFRTLVTTMIQDADAKGVTGAIDIMVPVVNYMEGKPGSKYPGAQRGAYDKFLGGGSNKEMWTYQSCMSHGCGGTVDIGDPSGSAQYYTGWPSYVIDSNAIRSRAQEWMSFRWGATGELYFETTMAYGHDAWNNQWDFSGNGDGTLFYPGTPAKIGGTTHIPIASIRLKMIREGMEDFEYLKRLADAGDPGLAKAITEAVFPNAYTTDVSPDDLMIAREKIANRILELTGKNATVAGVSGAPAGSGDVLAGLPSSSGGGTGEGEMVAANAGGCTSGPGNAGFLALLGIPFILKYLHSRRRKRD